MDKQQEEDEEDESVGKEWLSRRDRRNREKERKRVRAWESVRVFSAIVKSILSCTYVYVSSEMRARASNKADAAGRIFLLRFSGRFSGIRGLKLETDEKRGKNILDVNTDR